MPARKGLLAPQNTFLDTIATRFDGTHSNFVLGNAKIAKIYPIVYCSDGFCDLSGYSRAQIMQKSCACNFLYGQKTDPHHRESISRALVGKKELKLEVILYKSSGTPFWCLLDIVPIQDEKHEVVLFLCSHKDITKQKLHEQQQHQLAQLHAQKQQQLAAAAAAAAQRPTSPQCSDQQQNQQSGQQREDPQQQAASHAHSNADHPPADTLSSPTTNKLLEGQTDRKLEDVDEAELTAMANQNALLSMDEFGLQDDSGGEAGDFDHEGGSDSGDDHDKHTASQYSRRRSRAVLYQLSGHYGYRRSVNMKSKLKLNNRMNIPEYKTTTIEKQRFILSHYGVGKSCWDWLILVVSFYVAIVVPYNATFKDKQEDLMGGECKIDSIDILVELVFLIDVLLNFRTTFVNRKGEVVTRPEIICKHYVRGWFVVDACAALPFDLLCSLNLYSRSRLDLNLLKLIRLLRLARLLQKMDRYSQYSYIILTLLMLIFSLLAHWCACIWYVIAMEEIAQNPSDWKIGWLHQLSDKLGRNVVNATDMAASYVTALYFTTSSLTSVGFGNVSANTNAEKIFSIVIMLIGALMHAVVFGNVTALIRVMYARRSNYQTRLRDLKDFFRLHQLPKELQQRMSDYFQTTWSLNHGIETYEILKDFPEELRGDVSLHLHREVLSLPIFETAPQGFLKSLARHIESKFCCPTEYLIHRGDALNYLYLVCNGSMEVLQDNMVVAILGKGDLVGYDVNALTLTPEHTQFGLSSALNHCQPASMFGGGGGGGGGANLKQTQAAAGPLMSAAAHGGSKLVKSSSDLKALTYCDLKCIQIAGLLEVLKLYPEFSDTFQREIIHDLSFNLRENHDIDHENIMMGGRDHDDEDEDDVDDEEGDCEDGDEDDDEHDTGSEPPGGKPSNMNQLFRSIDVRQRRSSTHTNQIGRYDYVDDDDEEDNGADAAAEAAADEELATEDEQEDEDEEEDDDDEHEEGDDEDPGPHDHRGSGGGGDSGSHVSNSQPGEPEQPPQSQPQPRDDESANRRRKRANGRENGNVDKQQQQQAREEEEVEGDDRPEVAANRPRQESLRQRRMRAAAAGSGARVKDDSVSWHSYDCAGRTRGGDQFGGNRQLKSTAARHNSGGDDDGESDSNNNNGSYRQQQSPGGRLKLGSGSSGPAKGDRLATSKSSGGDRKPPIMFDLSRNTTVIVDRRRRSAGCILAARPLLIGPPSVAQSAAAANRRQLTNHSSLTHISETPTTSELRWPLSARRSVAAAQQRQRGVAASETTNYSSQDLRGLDTRMNCLSASVRELKHDLQQELNQMRGTMQMFVRMFEQQQQQQQQLMRDSSGSLCQIASPTIGPPPTQQRANRGLAKLNSKSSSSGGGVSARSRPTLVQRSQSASSLPAVSAVSSATGNGFRGAGILREESDADLAEHQSIASEPAAPVASISLDSAGDSGQKDSSVPNVVAPITSTARIASATGSSRTLSRCSQSTVSPQPQSAAQLQHQFSAQNFLQASNCHSDNDSGRSSSSMNSSSRLVTKVLFTSGLEGQRTTTRTTEAAAADKSNNLTKHSLV